MGRLKATRSVFVLSALGMDTRAASEGQYRYAQASVLVAATTPPVLTLSFFPEVLVRHNG
jgi:hypothetical protein